MRHIQRRALGRKAQVWLFQQTRAILGEPEGKPRYDKAAALWKSARDPRSTWKHRYFKQVKDTLERMTIGGLCMYCEHNVVHQIEHFWPQQKVPERAFCWENLLFVCGQCNNRKGTKYIDEARGELLFVDPTAKDPADGPDEHLQLSPKEGRFLARSGSRKGTNTAEFLNESHLVTRRAQAWSALQRLVVFYAEARAGGNIGRAEGLREDICKAPFSMLIGFLLRAADLPEPGRYITEPGCLEALRAHRDELRAWLAPAP